MSPRKSRRLPGDVPRRPRRAGGAQASTRAGRTPPGSASADGESPTQAGLGPPVVEEWPDGDWVVRLVPGEASVKLYRCPGCDQEIRPGTGHLVAWPAFSAGTEYRRHWHAACWRRRPRRQLPGLR